MPMLSPSGDGCSGIQPAPCFLHLGFILPSESTRTTSGTKRDTAGSGCKAAASVYSSKAGRVKLLWDCRVRPQRRCCHARPCGQAPTNHCGVYTNSSQSAPALFPSPARSSPGPRTPSRRPHSWLSLQPPPEPTRLARSLAPFVVPCRLH